MEHREQASPQQLTDAIGQLHAARCAIDQALLSLVAVYDREEHWRADGSSSMAAWLCGALGLSYRRAADWVEVASRLEGLPALAAVFAAGRLSYDQVRAASRFATPETDTALAEELPGHSAARIEARARREGASDAEQQRADRRHRALRIRWDREGRFLRVAGRLAVDQGAVVERALTHLAARAPRDPETGLYDSWEARMADALHEMASGALGEERDPDRATLVVHADAEALATGEGTADLRDGPSLSARLARSLACDARIEVVWEESSGRPLGVGRAARWVPPWLERQVRRRDGGCRFPGCGRKRFVSTTFGTGRRAVPPTPATCSASVRPTTT